MSTSISTYCVVFGCPNKGTNKKDNLTLRQENTMVTFHRFPNKQSGASCERYKNWLKNINREHFIPKPRSVVCSLHFTADLFRPDGRLLGNAVPTLYMGSPPKHGKLLVDKGVQCEMGRETYRSQPGVKIDSQKKEELGNENNSTLVAATQEASASSSYVISELLEPIHSVYVEDIKIEEASPLASPDAQDSFMDVQCNSCTCGECGSFNSESIGICCNQMGLENFKNNQANARNCIVFDENFDTVVLDFHVIMTRLHTMIIHCPLGDVEYCNLLKSTANNRLFRHVAYHQFRSWINSRLSLGIDQITLVPTCVINAVRQRYPENDNIYRELFRATRYGQENKLGYFD